ESGESLVVDWGLAKAVGRSGAGAACPAAATEGTLWPFSAGDDQATQPGSVLGTPAYMSPEQAAGRVDELSPASDGYSLGATLYTLLTGQAPFVGGDRNEVLHRVQRGAFARPREVKPDVPRPLEAICLKAMALAPEGRYASAQALAADVESWLGGEAVAAHRESLAGRVGRLARRHRTVVRATGVFLAALTVVLAGAVVALRAKQQQTDEARLEAVENARDSEQSLKEVFEAVDRMLIQTGAERLEGVARMDPA